MKQKIDHLSVRLSYALHSNETYTTIKTFFYRLLNDDRFELKRYFDLFMIALALFTVGLLMYEVKSGVTHTLMIVDEIAVCIFILEYLLRLWTTSDVHQTIINEYEACHLEGVDFRFFPVLWIIIKDKLSYITSPFAIIDLLSILPSYRPLRVLRVFLLFRLLKVFRHTPAMRHFFAIFRERKFEFFMLLLLVGMVLFIGSAAIFILEGADKNSNIDNLYDALYWAVITAATVGYGDITPQTHEGRFVAMILSFAGIATIAFLTTIMTSAFTEKLQLMKEERFLEKSRKYKKFIIICGFGTMGREFLSRFSEKTDDFLILDTNEERVDEARQIGFMAFCKDPTQSSVLQEVGIERAIDLLCLTDNDIANLGIILSARSLNPKINIIARISTPKMYDKYKIAGANHIISPYKTSGTILAGFLNHPASMEVLDGILYHYAGIAFEEIGFENFTTTLNIKKLDAESYKVIPIAVLNPKRKHGFYFKPHAGFELEQGDTLIVYGSPRAMKTFKAHVEKIKYDI